MSAPAPIIECEPVITGMSTVWTFFRTDIDSAGRGHGRVRLAEFTSPRRAREFGADARTGNAVVKGLDNIVDAYPSFTSTGSEAW